MMSCAEFSRKLELAALKNKAGLEAPTAAVMVIAEAQAKETIGTYRWGWTPLAESTKSDRERKGFAPDEPLERTGALRDSIQHMTAPTATGAEGVLYSDDIIALYQEMGTATIPARSFLYGSLYRSLGDIDRLFNSYALKLLAAI